MSEEKKAEKKMVRRVYIPEDVSIAVMAGDQGPRQVFPYAYWMEFLLNVGEMFNNNAQGGRMAVHIDLAYRDLKKDEEKGQEYFDLEQKPQPQWQALKHAAELPGGKQNPKQYPIPGRYLVTYIDSITEAEEVEVE